MEFVEWWAKNRGTTPFFVQVSIHALSRGDDMGHDQATLVDGDCEPVRSVLEFLLFAQYLEADTASWDEIRHRMERGDRILLPNLWMLVRRHDFVEKKDEDFVLNQDRIGFLDATQQSSSPLRRLQIEGNVRLQDAHIPSLWSTLTHVSFSTYSIFYEFWVHFIRSVPVLEWGFFKICEHHIPDDFPQPGECTVARLTTLSIPYQSFGYHLLSEFFAGLHMPGLRDLSLFHQWPGSPNDYIPELYTILRSTPNISTLTLTEGFVPLIDPDYVPPNIEPIRRYVLHLVHLQLEVDFVNVSPGEAAAFFDGLVNNLFTDNKWLLLDHPRLSYP
ncbi:hypothetical protein BDN70DRAFT_998760 [Pholiota conissans]|uniref:Uncharacterized protein n=1 Tax=Pholiota conissans TaxID=109636 RepID=A0A9P6CSY3_9AGAR|nr:hypothetical protein BDN70DRAFT_998760 [Pholiota conissans]